jgi:hypothetical protein
MDQFAKRESLVHRSFVEPDAASFRAIIYGGSMAYGSVRESSDVDLIVVTEASSIRTVVSHPYFASVDDETLSAFETSKIGFFWASREIEGVVINAFVYDLSSLERFALLEADLIGYRNDRSSARAGYDFSGRSVSIAADSEPFGTGWLYTRPALNNGAYYGGVPRDHFWFMYRTLVDDGSFEELAQRSRQAVIKQLVREHGPCVDLAQHNVLNTIHAYHERRDRVSDTTFDLIRVETRRLLEKS